MEPIESIEAVERATLAAVPPRQQQEWAGWLLPLPAACEIRMEETASAQWEHVFPGDGFVAQAAPARGLSRCFLQVEEANAAARSLYAARGFHSAWCYAYWQRP